MKSLLACADQNFYYLRYWLLHSGGFFRSGFEITLINKFSPKKELFYWNFQDDYLCLGNPQKIIHQRKNSRITFIYFVLFTWWTINGPQKLEIIFIWHHLVLSFQFFTEYKIALRSTFCLLEAILKLRFYSSRSDHSYNHAENLIPWTEYEFYSAKVTEVIFWLRGINAWFDYVVYFVIELRCKLK